MAMTKVFTCTVALLVAVGAQAATDPFETAKSDLAKAACVQIEFLSILESDVFDVIDTVHGTATIAQDGRFHVSVGTDEFLFDNTNLYSYSEQTDQVIIEEPSGDLFVGSEVALVTRLDDYYTTAVMAAGERYHLTKQDTTDTNLPDELIVHLQTDSGTMQSLEYEDFNGDLNRVVFQSQRLRDQCPDSAFVPNFPASAERVKL